MRAAAAVLLVALTVGAMAVIRLRAAKAARSMVFIGILQKMFSTHS
jgi:hypothetical protein